MRDRATRLLVTRMMSHSMSLASKYAGQSGAAAGTGEARSMMRPACMHARSNVQSSSPNCRSGLKLAPGPTHAGLGSALGWPVMGLHLQRKVNVWARAFNAEEALASPTSPAGLPYSNKSTMYGSNPSALGSSTAVETETLTGAIPSSLIIDSSDTGSYFSAAALNEYSVSEGTSQRVSYSISASDAAAGAAPGSSGSSSSAAELSTSFEAAAGAAAAPAADAPAGVSSSGSSNTGSCADGSSSAAPSSSSSSSSGSGEPPVSGNGAGPAIRLLLQSGAAMLPHPDKAHRGGEDSFFIADHQSAVGVADGVGGWAEIGVDAGAYARLLMVHAKEAADAAVEDLAAGTLSPQAILESAFYRTNVQGSSTACVLVVNGTTLSASNLGDSGFVLVRDGVATFQCPQQQHNFNFPFQLGSADSMSDQPQAAMRFDLQLQPGDIIVTGSDGLWDNIFAEEAATIVSKCRDKGESATTAAQVLCRYARMRASDAKYHSPFSYAAIQAGYVYLGGKMDDITVVVSYVSLPQSKL